jgi:hypothetical protein
VGDLQSNRKVAINRWNGKLILGYSSQNQLLLDLDNCSVKKAIWLARMIQQEWPEVGDCLVVHCGADSHHLVFSNRLSWSKISKILSVLCGLGILEKDYMKIRRFRKDLTLRVSPKQEENKFKPTPLPVAYLHGNNKSENNLINNYLAVLEYFK